MLTQTEHLVLDFKLDELKGKIADLNARARRMGCPEIRLDVFESHDTEVGEGEYERRIRVVVSGESPRINGWALVAKIERVDGKNLISTLPGHTVPEQYFASEPTCDHCHQTRERVYLYILVNEQGEYKQVGKTCLRDFLGHIDPHTLAEWMETWHTVEQELGDEDGDWDTERGHTNRYIDLPTFLSYVAASIEKRGWMSSGKAQAELRVATWTDAIDGMTKRHRDITRDLRPTDAHRATAAAAIEYAKDLKENTEFAHNLRTIAEMGLVSYRHLAFAACMVQGLQRAESERKAAGSTNHVGKVGEKINCMVTLIEKKTLPSDFYGQHFLLKFTDENGDLIVWFTAKDAEPGRYAMKAAVKEHSEYRGTKQTVVTRAKLTPIENNF